MTAKCQTDEVLLRRQCVRCGIDVTRMKWCKLLYDGHKVCPLLFTRWVTLSQDQ